VVKNKIAPPFKEVELTLLFGKGFDQIADLVGLASDMDIVKKAGSFYSYGEERIGQGKEKAIAYIAERPAMEQEIRDRVQAAIKAGNTAPEVLLGGPKGEALVDAN
jgi:recombination protein RecA